MLHITRCQTFPQYLLLFMLCIVLVNLDRWKMRNWLQFYRIKTSYGTHQNIFPPLYKIALVYDLASAGYCVFSSIISCNRALRKDFRIQSCLMISSKFYHELSVYSQQYDMIKIWIQEAFHNGWFILPRICLNTSIFHTQHVIRKQYHMLMKCAGIFQNWKKSSNLKFYPGCCACDAY